MHQLLYSNHPSFRYQECPKRFLLLIQISSRVSLVQLWTFSLSLEQPGKQLGDFGRLIMSLSTSSSIKFLSQSAMLLGRTSGSSLSSFIVIKYDTKHSEGEHNCHYGINGQ